MLQMDFCVEFLNKLGTSFNEESGKNKCYLRIQNIHFKTNHLLN